jgi:hypothetical protein
LTDAVEKAEKIEQLSNLAKDGVCLPQLLQASVGRVRSYSTWSLTSARPACTGGAEKFGSPARKTFFDGIGPIRKSYAFGCVLGVKECVSTVADPL